ncbi:prenyltransferase and squalene oxidase repeat domain-containing protein [Sarocladium implicatum]|nr:prenyltransferase and squalene oxidase repeat domain-containing protein [Sarocladium implicatum]
MAASVEPLDRERHLKYFKRCHKSLLPTPYTSSDSTRLTFACFVICALNLLDEPLTPSERSDIRNWVLSLQHPDGGFCGSSTHAFSGRDTVKGDANLAATFFALILLAAASDGDKEASAAYSGVNRSRLLRWLRKLQRKDGSLGQNLWEGRPVGGSDMRHCYLASSIRWMLGGGSGQEEGEDLDVESMVAFIRRGQTYDGGLAESSQNESHGGYVYCGVAALAMLDRDTNGTALRDGTPRHDDLIKFLAHRQFPYMAAEEEAEAIEEDAENLIEQGLEALSMAENSCEYVGYNGRWNKKADTCYCWWAGGALKLLDKVSFMKRDPSRSYLLGITQHRIGGFSKTHGGPPDIFHSYLGLAALAVMGKDGFKEFDEGLCCSQEISQKIALAREGLREREQRVQWKDDGFWDAVNKS